MDNMQQNTRLRWLVICVLAILLATCSPGAQPSTHSPGSSPNSPNPLIQTTLPGQEIWKQGISSFLFGTNDTQEWTANNLETQPALQEALRSAGFTLIRSFFLDNASDTDIEQRIKTIENSHAHCLGVITNISNMAYDEHLVQYLGSRCLMYEFGNEPDYTGISSDTYLQQWNKLVPLLRHINPNAKFIGPVTYRAPAEDHYFQDFLKGVKSSGVLPDAVSFHWYPCWQIAKEQCLAQATSVSDKTQKVRELVKSILGKDLPIGITEWNYDPGNPPPAYGDDPRFITDFTNQALAAMIQAGVAFACQFDAASYSGYGHLDMLNTANNQPKPQYDALKALIATYRPANSASTSPATSPVRNSGELISRGKPVYCSESDSGPGGPAALVNGHYGNWSFWGPQPSSLPSWCAIHVGAGPTRLLLAWYSNYVYDYIDEHGTTPQNYTISVSADSTNGSDGTWHTVINVVGNQTRNREHVFPFAGQAWVKMTITSGQAHPTQPTIFMHQIDLFDVSASLNNTFIFAGDSISASAYDLSDAKQPSFAEDVHAALPQHYPMMLNGGIGGRSSTGAVRDIDLLLTLNPDVHYWLIQIGTNDAFGEVSPDDLRANLQILVDKIKRAGHVPIFAHIPYTTIPGDSKVNSEIQSLNVAIDQVTKTNGLIAGPDLYTLFQAHAQEYLNSDGIHPTNKGSIALNLAWFQTLKPYLYA